MTAPKKVHSKMNSGEQKNAEINFPCGNLEEMLRMAKKYCAKENFDCGEMIKHFIGKQSKTVCCNKMMEKHTKQEKA